MKGISAILGTGVLLLGAVLVLQWWSWGGPGSDSPAPADLIGEDRPASQSDLQSRPALDPVADYAEVVERVLFVESRRPPAVIAQPETETETDPGEADAKGRPELTITGLVLTSPEQRYALAEDPAGARLRLAPGDDYRGWHVESLATGRLVLTRRGRSETYLLRDYGQADASAETAPDRRRDKRLRAGRRERP